MASRKTPIIPGFVKSTIGDGIRVLTESVPSVRSAAVGVWVYTGSRDEHPDQAGISHFIEHMVFKGTRKRRLHQIANYLESVGGYLNAFTAKEYTSYYARVLDDHTERAVDLLTDLVLQPTLPPKELEREKDVVIEEMKMYEDSPEELVFDYFEEVLYGKHPMGRPVIGYPETVRAFSRENLGDYLDTRYTPDRIVLAAAGNIAHQDLVRMAEKAFAVSQRRPGGMHRSLPGIPNPEEKVFARPIQQAHLVLGTRCFSVHDPRRMALTVLNTVLGGGMSSRLNQNIREKHGFCYSIYSFVNLHSDTGDMGVYMGTDAGKIERSKQLIWRELDRLAQEPVSARLLTQAKAQVKGSLMLGLENMNNRMTRIARQELFYGQYLTLDDVVAEIDRVTADDLLGIARELFVKDQFSTVVLEPTKG